MAFSVPTLGEVVRTVENGFSTAFYGLSGVLRVTVLKLMAKVIGAAVYLPLLCCKYIWQNSFVSTADAESLCKIGTDYSLPHKPATFAHGAVTFVGGANGVKVPAGTVLVCESSGTEYETLEDVSLSSNSVDVNVRAVAYGSESNLTNNTSLKFRDGAIGGLEYGFSSGVDGGRAESVQVGANVEDWGETLEEYRARLKFRKQNQPQGGSQADFVSWCQRFDFVTDVYPFSNWPATNNVTLFVANGAVADYSVASSDVSKVQAYVQDASRKPLCCNPVVKSVSTVDLQFTVTLSDVTETNKTSVTQAIKNFLRKFGPGEIIQSVDLQAVARSASGDASAVVGRIYVSNYGYTDSYTLPKTAVSGVPAGSVVNLNTINISWIKAQ